MNRIGLLVGIVITALTFAAAPALADGHGEQVKEAEAALANFESKDPGIKEMIGKAHGYVVFPMIEKGAVIVGAAHGRGVAFEGDQAIGSAAVTQATVGLQLGAQIYSQLMVFQNAETFARFKENKWAWAAEATAVAATAGTAAKTDFVGGVAVFVTDQQGIMGSLAVGGQKFTFTPF